MTYVYSSKMTPKEVEALGYIVKDKRSEAFTRGNKYFVCYLENEVKHAIESWDSPELAEKAVETMNSHCTRIGHDRVYFYEVK